MYIGGARGTGPWVHDSAREFGGDSTSILITGEAGEQVVIDAGSGLERIAPRVHADAQPVLMAFTHYHLDHVCGLPSFPWLYRGEARLTFIGPDVESGSIGDVLARWVQAPWWPVGWEQTGAQKSCCALPSPGEALEWGGLRIRCCAVPHAGGCVAYRIDEPARGSGLVIATDLEWAASSASQKNDFLSLCASPGPADVLVFDAQFLPEEYPSFVGWGHSTWHDALDIHKQTGVERILLTHHGRHADATLCGREKHIQAVMPMMEFARQGMEWEI